MQRLLSVAVIKVSNLVKRETEARDESAGPMSYRR